MHCPPIGGLHVYSVDVWDGGWASTVLGVDPQHCRCLGWGPSIFSVGGWPPTQRGLHTMPSWTEKSKTNEVSSLAPGSETKKGYKCQNLIYICFSNRPFGLRPWRRTGSLHLSLTFGLSCSLYDRYFRPTSDGNILETVCLIYLKLSQILTHLHGPNLWKFHVN